MKDVFTSRHGLIPGFGLSWPFHSRSQGGSRDAFTFGIYGRRPTKPDYSEWALTSNLILGHIGAAVYTWDARTGRVVNSFLGHDGPIAFAKFSLDGEHIITGSMDDREVQFPVANTRCWDAATGRQLWQADGNLAQDISRDGKRILTSTVGNGARGENAAIWDAILGRQLIACDLDAHGGNVNTKLVFSPNGRQFLSYDSTSAALYDSTTGAEIGRRPITSRYEWFDGDGFEFYGPEDTVASSFGGEVAIWDFRRKSEICPSPNDKFPNYRKAKVSPDPERMWVSQSANRFIVKSRFLDNRANNCRFELFEIGALRAKATIYWTHDPSPFLCLSTEGDSLLIGGPPFTVYDLKTCKPIQELDKLENPRVSR